MTKNKPKYLQAFTIDDLCGFLKKVGYPLFEDSLENKQTIKITYNSNNLISYSAKIMQDRFTITLDNFECNLHIYSQSGKTNRVLKKQFAKFVYDKLKRQDINLAEEYKKDYNSSILEEFEYNLLP